MKKPGIKYHFILIFISLISIIGYSQIDTSVFSRQLDKAKKFENENLDSAIFYCKKGIELSKSENDRLRKAESMFYLAHLLKNKGDYTTSLEYSFSALKIFEAENDIHNIIATHALIGSCYSLSKNNILAKEHFLISIKIGEENNDIQATSYIGYGNVLYYQDSIELAEEIYIKAIDQIQETGETSALLTASIFTNLGNIKFMQDDFASALKFYDEGYQLYTKTGNNMGICITSYNIGEVHYKLEDYEQAEQYFNITLEKGTAIKSIDDIKYALESLYDTYKKQNRFEKALEYVERYQTLKDSLNKIAFEQKINELELKYQKEKNESKLREQKKQIEDAKIEKLKDNQVTKMLIWGIISLTIISIISLISFLKIKKKNQIIEFSKIEIDKSLRDKNILLKEIHHRVKNNLQMISSLLNLQTYSLKNKDAIKALEESKNRVQAIALVHQKLYQDANITEINLNEYVLDLSEIMGQFYAYDKPIKYDINISEINLNVDTAVPLGLIICELISNSQKHAFEKVEEALISIKVAQQKNGKFLLEYRDNGIGLPDQFSIENLNSLGFEIIESLSQQLDGDITIGTKYGMFVMLNFSKI